MRLAIDQPTLERELALVAAAAGTQSTIPRLSQVRLEARDSGALRLTVHNLEYGLASEMEARVTEPGLVCLSAKPLLSLVSALEGEITIHTDPNCYATITAGRSRSRMPGEAADAFGELEPMPEGTIGLPAEILVQLLARVGFAVGRTSGTFQLPAALVRSANDTLVCAATDGSRLALAQAALTAAEPYEFLFPSEAMVRVKRLVEGQEHPRVAIGAQHLFVAAGTRLLSARQLAGRFPDYQRVLPRFDRPPTEIDSSALRSAMHRVLLFTESGTRVDPKMRFLLRPGELSVSAMSDRAGEGEHTVVCDYSGPEIAVGFNPRYILEFLDVVPKGTLRVWIKDDHTPTEWRPGSDDTYRYIVGPLKG